MHKQTILKTIKNFFYKVPSDNITIVGKYDCIEGHMTVGKLYVDGTVKSKKPLEVKSLVVSTSGNVEANIVTDGAIDIYGIVTGHINANKVTIHKGAVVQGHITYTESFKVDENSCFMGNVKKHQE